MERSKGRLRPALAALALCGALLLLWEWGVRSGHISSLALPRPSGVLVAVVELLGDSVLARNWWHTLQVWSASVIIGISSGLALGLAAGISERTATALLPLFGYFRSIPPIALFPVALVALGPGQLPVGVVASLGAALYMFPTTTAAARAITNQFSELAEVLNVDRYTFILRFIAPGTVSQALASGRIAATYSFAACVGGEMIIGGRTGVGAAILELSERHQLEEAYAYVLLAGLVGFAIDFTFWRISHLRLLGQPPSRDYGGHS